MRYKMEDFLVLDKGVATDEVIENAKEELMRIAKMGYRGEYVPDSIVFKVQEKMDEVYVCAEWEEETKKGRKRRNDQGADDPEEQQDAEEVQGAAEERTEEVYPDV